MTGWTWVEPFAGAAACALRLVGGRDLSPPVAWMGGKRRYARAILDAMGVPDSPPSRVLLADAGPWGWVWPLLLKPADAAAVAAVLRSWAGEHPRDLWQRLAAQPPADDLHERAAQWLWLQARSASGVPIWWDGWRLEAGNGKAPTDRGNDLRWAGHREEHRRWQAMNGRGTPSAPGFNTGQEARDGKRWEKGTPDGRPPQDATNGQRGVWRASNGAGDEVEAGQKGLGGWSIAKSQGRTSTQPAWQKGDAGAGDPGWRMGEELKKARRGDRTISQGNGSRPGKTGGLVDPHTIADRVVAIAEAFRDVDVSVHHGDVRELEIPRGAFVYDDPPYAGATGYGWDLDRAGVLALARAHRKRAAVVAVSEAVALPLRGWHALELTREGGKAEYLTLSRAPARLPARQGDLFSCAPDDAPASSGRAGG